MHGNIYKKGLTNPPSADKEIGRTKQPSAPKADPHPAALAVPTLVE
jgi:hypothetical protein